MLFSYHRNTQTLLSVVLKYLVQHLILVSFLPLPKFSSDYSSKVQGDPQRIFLYTHLTSNAGQYLFGADHVHNKLLGLGVLCVFH